MRFSCSSKSYSWHVRSILIWCVRWLHDGYCECDSNNGIFSRFRCTLIYTLTNVFHVNNHIQLLFLWSQIIETVRKTKMNDTHIHVSLIRDGTWTSSKMVIRMENYTRKVIEMEEPTTAQKGFSLLFERLH